MRLVGVAEVKYSWLMWGTYSRSNLYIMSRTTNIDADTYRMVVEIARSQGFDAEKLEPVPQPQS